ncbi:MAG: hypothetical protein CVU11_00680 [Bacteroidetes bacterium HGW-Bacteroidetes-6]|nr:MAG: hypothetical protein CVU11_00680 [Bacteroidetes bacterium HGW-Bacteroidetes-6]
MFCAKIFHNFVKPKQKPMKTIIKASFIFAVVAALFSGCKKGENDPFLSLKSRTSRLSKEWKLVSADYTETFSSTGSVDYYSSTHYTYDGAEMNESNSTTIGTNTTTSTDSYLYSINVEFTKEGSFEQTISSDGITSVGAGYWTWIHKIKDQELSNKEAVILTYASGTSNSTLTGTSINPDQIMVIDKLSSSELVVIYDYKETTTDGDVLTQTGTMTFQEK